MKLVLACLAALAFTTGGLFMKQADGLRGSAHVLGFVLLFSVGASLQSLAMRDAELGTTYILVLGLEAAMALGMGLVFFGEEATLQKAAAVALILAGIALLRVS